MRYIKTDLTCRLDNLPWTWFHTKFVMALGITWILDAFEVVIVSVVLKSMAKSLNLSVFQSSWLVSSFLIGALVGAFIFGYLADKFGRKKVFFITLLLYSLGTFLTGFANSFEIALLLRFITGFGLGGEFSAIHSAIDEFIPSRFRGRVDGFITASWNLGSIFASLVGMYLLSSFPEEKAWRYAFLFGGSLAILIVFIRFFIPESPRWLISKGLIEQAEEIVSKLEKKYHVKPINKQCEIPVFEGSLLDAVKIILKKYRGRFLFGTAMSFTILTTYYGFITILPLVITNQYNLPTKEIPNLLLTASIGGLIGGIVVSFLSDKLGRKITGTTIALFSLLTSFFFLTSQDIYTAVFVYSLVAYSFASVAYVSAMEVYPSYLRATAIGVLSVIGRISGMLAPPMLTYLATIDYKLSVLGLSMLWLVGFIGFFIWSKFGVEAKGKSIEDIT
ncbi:MAG: MFS transporter [Sulfurihydrogenibium sp.]|jgi:MFS family permease|nr:MFS transporter [Sulfurihydrogenibium sp.]